MLLRANGLRVFPPYLVLPKRRWRQAGALIPPAICFSASRPPHSPLTTSSSCCAPKRYSLSPLVRATSPRFSASPRCPMANTYTWSRTGFAATTPPPRASCTTPDCSPATLATAKHSSTAKTLSPLPTSSHKQAMPPTPTTKANSGELYERSMIND